MAVTERPLADSLPVALELRLPIRPVELVRHLRARNESLGQPHHARAQDETPIGLPAQINVFAYRIYNELNPASGLPNYGGAAAISIPFVGPYVASLVFGGEFPTMAFVPRLPAS